jgi:hypothetical protein
VANSPHFEPHPEIQKPNTKHQHNTMDSPDTAEMATAASNLNLLDLPSELHIQIASFLSYPDALALKHSCRHFYSMVYTGVHLKVNWLVERFERKLECPMEKCSFRTDEAFCNWRIRRIMERRRQHLECRRAPGGCWVVEGQTCHTDLVPLWLKGQGPRRVVKSLATLVHEGLLFYSRYVDGSRLTWCIISIVGRLFCDVAGATVASHQKSSGELACASSGGRLVRHVDSVLLKAASQSLCFEHDHSSRDAEQ